MYFSAISLISFLLGLLNAPVRSRIVNTSFLLSARISASFGPSVEVF